MRVCCSDEPVRSEGFIDVSNPENMCFPKVSTSLKYDKKLRDDSKSYINEFFEDAHSTSRIMNDTPLESDLIEDFSRVQVLFFHELKAHTDDHWLRQDELGRKVKNLTVKAFNVLKRGSILAIGKFDPKKEETFCKQFLANVLPGTC